MSVHDLIHQESVHDVPHQDSSQSKDPVLTTDVLQNAWLYDHTPDGAQGLQTDADLNTMQSSAPPTDYLYSDNGVDYNLSADLGLGMSQMPLFFNFDGPGPSQP